MRCSWGELQSGDNSLWVLHNKQATFHMTAAIWSIVNVKILISAGGGWRFSIFFLLSTNLMYRTKPTMKIYFIVLCVYPKPDMVFLCAVDLHCCPKTTKNTSVSHILHHKDYSHVSLFRNSSKEKQRSCFQSLESSEGAGMWFYFTELC